jgi:PAS domain S-box-containing protein
MKVAPTETSPSIRQRAEEKARLDQVTATKPLSLDEAQKLLHELQLHQIELKMQNDELERRQIKLESALALYDMAPIGYLILNEKGMIQEANIAAAAMLGVARDVLLNTSISKFIFQDDLDYFLQFSKSLSKVGVLNECEIRLVKKDGSRIWVLFQATSSSNGELWITLSDISERKLTEDLLRESEKLTVDVMNSLTSNIAVLDSNGTIVLVNEPWQRFARENGDPGLVACNVGTNYLKVCMDSIGNGADEGARSAFSGISSVLQGQKDHFSLEYPCHMPNKNRWFILNASRLTGSRNAAVITHTDITDRKNMENILQNNNRNLEKIIAEKTFQLTEAQRIAHIGSWDLDHSKSEWQWSDEVFRIYGLENFELPVNFDSFLKHVHPEDRQMVQTSFTKSVVEYHPFHIRHRIIRKSDNKTRYVRVQCNHTCNTEGFVTTSLGTVQDITQLVVKENELKEYAHHIVKMIENERTRIARELHDDLGQKLTVLSFAINQLKHDHSTKPNVLQPLPEMQGEVDHMMESIRRICTALRPAHLDELGLQASLEWLCKDFTRRTGLPCSTTIASDCCSDNNKDCWMTIFRIVQESLNNAMKHSGASEVSITLSRNNTAMHVEITDDGCGFKSGKRSADRSFGVIGMRERANAIGASFVIISKRDKGTSVILDIPCLCEEEKNAISYCR